VDGSRVEGKAGGAGEGWAVGGEGVVEEGSGGGGGKEVGT